MAQWNYNTNFSSLTGLPTPELKISETIGNLMGVPSQMNGTSGSNLFGQYQVTPQEQGTVDYVNQINQVSPQNPQLSGSQNLSRISSNPPAVLGASTSGGGDQSLVDKYKASGWNDMNAIMADIAAGGGSKFNNNPSNDYNNQMMGLIGQNESDLLGGLQPSYQNQLNMANQWGTQSTNDLNANVQSNVGDLTKQIGTVEQGQVKSLKDVADNIRNLMQAGNTYLGARGAGDSSAVNQYAYGLTKLGSQQRGDVMSQAKDQIGKINDNIAKVNLVATQEKQKIDYEVGQKTQEIAQWFADQQTQIKSAANKDKQALATNLYNQAVSQLAQLQNYAQSRQAQIESWALSNSTSAKQAIQKLQEYGSYQAAAPVYNPIQGNITTDAGGNMSSGFRGGGTGGLNNLSEDQKRLLGLA